MAHVHGKETAQPDRVKFVLPMVSLLPEESVERIKGRFGTKFKKLSAPEVQALVTADLEGGVSNLRMRQICNEHPTELTKLLQNLVGRGFLKQMAGGEERHTGCRDQRTPLIALGTPYTEATPHINDRWTPHISSKRFPKRSLRRLKSLRLQLLPGCACPSKRRDA